MLLSACINTILCVVEGRSPAADAFVTSLQQEVLCSFEVGRGDVGGGETGHDKEVSDVAPKRCKTSQLGDENVVG